MTEEQRVKRRRWSSWLPLPLVTILVLLALAAVRPNLIPKAHRFLGVHLGWLYLGSMSVFLVFALLLGFSSLGKRKLGTANSQPEFSRVTWFAMVLSAGTSVQFVYSAVAEPLMQAAAPPFGRAGPQEGALNAMNITLFHWSLHPWAVFTVVALCLAYASHRRELPLKFSSAFYPALGDRVHGRPGAVIDAIATLSTILIVAATLVTSAPAITAGLEHLWYVPPGLTTQLGIVLAVSCVATIAAASGLRQAIRRFCELNLVIIVGLLLFVLLAGQTLYLAANFADSIWAYLSYLPSNANELGLGANHTESRWLQRWTVPYWAWWIAWAPAVGLFIAKISKGRTIRDVVVFVLIVPALVSSAWFATLGNAAFFEQTQGQGMMSFAASGHQEAAIFELLDSLPWSQLGIVLTIMCMLLCAITSTAAASVAMAASASDSRAQRVYGAGTAGIIAFATLCAGSAIALWSAALAMALPLCGLILVMCVCLLRAVRTEDRS